VVYNGLADAVEKGYCNRYCYSDVITGLLYILGVESNTDIGEDEINQYNVKINGKWYRLSGGGIWTSKFDTIFEDNGIISGADSFSVKSAKRIEFERNFKKRVGWNDADSGVKDHEWSFDPDLTRVPCTEEELIEMGLIEK
jgi:hypothetical protein